jgi:hypothetical protein
MYVPVLYVDDPAVELLNNEDWLGVCI